jgi:alpha-ribazole phosphatase
VNIYLIRHTKPAVARGVCYGQADIDVVETFIDEAQKIKPFIPTNIEVIYSSPLQRCRKLAEQLFTQPIHLQHELKEIHCGEWELREWDAIPKQELQPWMDDFVEVRIPGGESYVDLYKRTSRFFDKVVQEKKSAAIVTHGGVIRSILAHVTNTPLKNSFNQFAIHYGCVAHINSSGYNMLYNFSAEKEQHRPQFK